LREPPIRGSDASWSVPKITKFNEWIVKDQFLMRVVSAILHGCEKQGPTPQRQCANVTRACRLNGRLIIE